MKRRRSTSTSSRLGCPATATRRFKRSTSSASTVEAAAGTGRRPRRPSGSMVRSAAASSTPSPVKGHTFTGIADSSARHAAGDTTGLSQLRRVHVESASCHPSFASCGSWARPLPLLMMSTPFETDRRASASSVTRSPVRSRPTSAGVPSKTQRSRRMPWRASAATKAAVLARKASISGATSSSSSSAPVADDASKTKRGRPPRSMVRRTVRVTSRRLLARPVVKARPSSVAASSRSRRSNHVGGAAGCSEKVVGPGRRLRACRHAFSRRFRSAAAARGRWKTSSVASADTASAGTAIHQSSGCGGGGSGGGGGNRRIVIDARGAHPTAARRARAGRGWRPATAAATGR